MVTIENIEELTSIEATDDKRLLNLIDLARNGIHYNIFYFIVRKSPFEIKEWSDFLHLSERTIQRYKKEKKPLVLSIQKKYLK